MSKTRVDLNWKDNSSNEKGFQIERSTGSTFKQALVTFSVGANVSTYSDTSAKAATQYYYRVRATNDAGASNYSNTAAVKTPR